MDKNESIKHNHIRIPAMLISLSQSELKRFYDVYVQRMLTVFKRSFLNISKWGFNNVCVCIEYRYDSGKSLGNGANIS